MRVVVHIKDRSVRIRCLCRVNIELDVEAAVTAGGELLGRRRQLELALAKPVTLVALAKDPS